MAPTTFTLIALSFTTTPDSFVQTLKSLPQNTKPLWLGQCHHWLHAPHLSRSSLTNQRWDYLLITTSPITLPQGIQTWSITAPTPNETLASLPPPPSPTPAPLLEGWSPQNPSALEKAIPHSGVEFSLSTTSPSPQTNAPMSLKDFILTFGRTHPGPVAMFNLLSYLPNQRENYFKYVAAFTESVGSKYGGEPIVLGFGVTDWSSREEEKKGGQEGKWEDTALIGYPSIWHFGKMIDDEAYTEVDRKYKVGVLRDNPLLCCTEVKLED